MVAEADGVGLTTAVSVTDGVGLSVGVSWTTPVALGVTVDVAMVVGVSDARALVAVASGVAVSVAVEFGVSVGDGTAAVAVALGVGDAAAVGVAVSTGGDGVGDGSAIVPRLPTAVGVSEELAIEGEAATVAVTDANGNVPVVETGLVKSIGRMTSAAAETSKLGPPPTP